LEREHVAALKEDERWHSNRLGILKWRTTLKSLRARERHIPPPPLTLPGVIYTHTVGEGEDTESGLTFELSTAGTSSTGT
jgi:hypothetical protein